MSRLQFLVAELLGDPVQLPQSTGNKTTHICKDDRDDLQKKRVMRYGTKRPAIVEALRSMGAVTLSALQEKLEGEGIVMTQNMLYAHMQYLRKAGIAESTNKRRRNGSQVGIWRLVN